MKARLFILLRVIVSFTLIGVILWLLRDKIPSIISTVKGADPFFLVIGIATFITAVFFIGLRLKSVISVQGIRFTTKESIYLTFIGYFFNNFMPTSVGGDLVKAYYAGKRSNKRAEAFAGIFMDRFLAMLPFTLVPALTIFFFSATIENPSLRMAIYALFCSSFLFVWLLLHKTTVRYLAFILEPFKASFWYKKLQRGYESLNIYSQHKIIVLRSFALSIVAQATSIISCYFFARAIGIDHVGLQVFFVIVPVVSVMSLLPSINGLGIREGGFVYLLKAYMLPEQAFAISILFLMSLTIAGVIGGVIYALKKSTFSVNLKEAM